MFLEPTRSPFDLSWRMFGVGVRVHPTFWLFSLMMGWSYAQLGMIYVLIWVACTFVSILVHELGHVAAGRLFGQPGNIVLYSFGGLAIGNYQETRRWQRIIISLAGPAAGFALYRLVLALDEFWFKQAFIARFDRPFAYTIRFLVFMNLLWSALNLIPVFPLDGGQVLREVMTGVSPRRGFRWALGVSFLIGGLIAIYSVLVKVRNTPETPLENHLPWLSLSGASIEPLFTGILFGLLALQSFLLQRQLERQERQWYDD